jgi:uncharacterized membrane protein
MEIRNVNAGRGFDWIAEGFGLFRRNPLIWVVISVVYLAITAVISLVPFIGTAALSLLQPVLGAGLMAGCRDLAEGEELRIEHLFEGFRRNTQPLLTVGLLTLAAYIVIGAISMGAFLLLGGAAANLEMLSGDFPNVDTPMEALPAMGGMLLGGLIFLALLIPIAMATWFAPALVWFRGLPALEAMKQSFFGCWRNILPFLLYGLAALVLLFLAMIPFGLGLLVLGPTLVGSVYASYREIFPDGER